MRPTVNNVLNFLHTLYAQDLSYSTINTARSALSACLLDTTFSGTNYTITNHPLLIRYMKGVFNSRKPTPKYSETWDVNIVLNYLAKLFPLDNLSLKDHSFKLVMLLALTSGQRCQTLTYLDIQSMKETPDYYVFQLTEHIKQNRPGNVFSTFHVGKYHQEELCVYHTLKSYLYRTAPLRGGTSTRLLISYVKPHGAVTTNTLSRWIKQVLTSSGIDTSIFKAHSTRSASVSKVSNFLPVDVILKHVGWSSDCVFRKHYNKPIVDNPRANGAKRRSGRKPGARVTNSALAFTYIRIMRCYIAQWHSGIKIKSRPIRHFLCHGRW